VRGGPAAVSSLVLGLLFALGRLARDIQLAPGLWRRDVGRRQPQRFLVRLLRAIAVAHFPRLVDVAVERSRRRYADGAAQDEQ